MNLLKFASLMTAATTNNSNLLPSFMKMQKDDANAAAEAECMDKGVSFVCDSFLVSRLNTTTQYFIPLFLPPVSLSTLLGRNDVLST